MNVLNFLEEKKIKETYNFLTSYLPENINTGIIFGSFLNKCSNFLKLKNKIEIPYKKIPNMPLPSVIGHDRILIYGEIEGKKIIIFGGRCHLYEGSGFSDVIYPVLILKKFLAKNLIVTNSAGGINPEFCEDDLMLISDHINFMFENPFFGYKYNEKYDYFLDMNCPYSTKLTEIAKKSASEIKINIKEGIYAGVKGPVLETRAEINMLRKLGADAVGMSTIPEVTTGNYFNINILGISHIRNIAANHRTNKGIKENNKFSHTKGRDKELFIGKKLADLIEIILKKA
jgi:purine-nucleoside phosphorylase